ncbi:TolC family protein [Trinickia dinghuensis]|uniref:TolC family protein n=1 Tax=Trinickia dinghuensis TaxID=2291023 RepID=A0A3D8JVZ6_9BURK|nr:TolC family protein [Trinickia dinghuensis]RDU97313.1 TolC family protein [Trinickia dinghuensis]
MRSRSLTLLGAVAGALAIGGCASYRPLPLAEHAQLADRIGAIAHTLPAPEPGAAAVVIDVDHPLSIDQVGLLAILNDPELRTERGESDLARADLTQSATLPNPSVSLGYAALLGGPGTTGAFTASLAQDVASLVTYRSHVSAARAHVSEVDANLLWNEWQVAQKARLLAVDLYWGERSIESSETQLQSLEHAASAVRSAVNAGSMSLSDSGPLLTSTASAEHALGSMRLDRLKNWQDLDALLGLKPDVRFVIAKPQVREIPADLDRLISSVPARRPDLVALQLGYRSADEDVRAAILGQFPAFVLGGTYGSDTSDVRSAGPTATFDLPIFNRNQGQVAKTRATRLLLHEQYQSRLDQSVSNALALAARSRGMTEDLTQARQAAATAVSQAEAAKSAYEQNNLDARTLVDYESTASDRRLEVFNLERGLDEARIALALELGVGLPQTRIAPLDPQR